MIDISYTPPEASYGAFNEEMVEQAALDIFRDLGWEFAGPAVIGPDGSAPERASYGDVILSARLSEAVARLNPDISVDAQRDAIRQILSVATPDMIEENRRIHTLLIDGVDVEFSGPDGAIKGDKVRLIDFNNPDENDWLVTQQFTVIENRNDRRPDVVAFLNGLPLGVVELKSAGHEAATVDTAFAQLQTYKALIPSLFRTNAVLIASDAMKARIGSLTAKRERFMPWRTVTGAADDLTPPNVFELDTLLRGVFDKTRFLALLRDFSVYSDQGKGPFKIVAGYHQFHGARHALRHAIDASREGGDRKIGVIWHTQGSGKSLLMAFFAGLVVRAPELENPTVVVVTDRNDLDDQLFGTFSLCRDLLRQTPEQAEGRDDLRERLDRASGGVIFTTMQKFSPEKGEESFPALTQRRNVIVMADEAHRSQYGFDAKLDAATGERRYGHAHYLREALPNASFIGFTGTPIEAEDVNTPAVFGEYIDIYDITRAVDDGATVPIFYESRLARIDLDDAQKPLIDAEIEAMLEDETLSQREKQKGKWSTTERLVGSDKRIAQVAADIVTHLEARIDGMRGGKAMAVCMSRRICVAMYDAIIALRPDWHSEDDDAGAVKIVMTGSASDPVEWQQHIGNKKRRDALAKRARDESDPLKLVIVRDMWLTGFDAPSMHTMYVDKPMRGHGLMQAIARVNRVFGDKPGGLVVDYIGIGQNLKKALSQYTENDRDKTGIDEEEAVAALNQTLHVVRTIFHGHDYSAGVTGEPAQRLAALGYAIDWVSKWTETQMQAAEGDSEKSEAKRRFQDNVVALRKAFALSSASDTARSVRDEVGFFEAVRAQLAKLTASGTKGGSVQAREFAIGQLIDGAVANVEIVDVLKAVGMTSPDISVLSPEFLADIQKLEQKNLALEALKRLLNGEIKSRAASNVTEAKQFSERLEEALARYHAGALDSLQVLQAMVDMAKDLSAAAARGEEDGLSPEERAFYDALAAHDTAVEAMGSDALKAIAVEVLQALQSNATVDWNRRENARARMRTLVKRILKRRGYPPDLSDAAVQNVLAQAEAFLRSEV